MPAAVFGDFLAAASEHLEAAVTLGEEDLTRPPAVAEELSRLVAVMSRYCDDLAPCDQVEASGRDDLHPWERAAIDAAGALRIASGCVRRASGQATADQVSGTAVPQRAQHLAAAAAVLAAGRDLLHTHLAADPDGLTRARSEWASAVTSVPVTRALVHEITRLSMRLAPFTAWLAACAAAHDRPDMPSPAVPASVRDEFAAASQWLQAAGAAVRPALDADPVRPADAELLRAIPAVMVPQRRRPGPSAESVARLCDGITISASRLRGAMRDSQDRARWSPNVTSGGWQWMAQAAAVTAHLGELALRALATRDGQLANPPVRHAQLDDAADLMAAMRAAWQQVDHVWDTMITESRLLPTPAMTEASDLVLRMGRLVWDDPHWTPAHPRPAPMRTPTALAPGTDAVTTVVAAVHQAVDALARTAEADTSAVQAAGQAGRLYVPTRSLPADSDVPRPYATAPVSRCRALEEAYRVALNASIQAMRALDELAVAASAPSNTLALARAAAPTQSRRPGSQPPPDDSNPGGQQPTANPFTHTRAPTDRPGPVEQTIRQRHISDPVMLLRAAAIDSAAQQLLTQAENATPGPDSLNTPANRPRVAGSAAQLAAQSFPRDLATRSAAGQPPRPTRHASSSSSRVTRRDR